MELSGQQRRQLRDALNSAFPTYSLLEQLLDFELDKKLNQIAQDSDLKTVAYQLIQTAQAQGWLIALVRAARKENPGNSQLKAIATELLDINPTRAPYNSSKENAIAEYRLKVKEFAEDGEISYGESEILKDLQKKLKLTEEEVRTIRDEALEPFGRYRENLDKYRQVFTKWVDEQGYPLKEKAKADLKKVQEHYQLKDDDITLLEKEAEQQEAQRRQYPLTNLSVINTLSGHSKAIGALPSSSDSYAISSVPISPDGKTLVSGSNDNTIKIWDLKTGMLLGTLRDHSRDVYCVAISPKGHTLVSSSLDTTIKVWNLDTKEMLRTLHGHSNTVPYVAISPDGRTLVSGSYDNTIKIWDLATGNLISTLTDRDKVESVAISPDGQTLVSSGQDNTIKIWNLTNGDLRSTLVGHSNIVKNLAISPDGQILASSSYDATIKIWNLRSGNLIRTLTGHFNVVWQVAISPDGKTLVSVSDDTTIKIWNLRSGNLIRNLTNSSGVGAISISPDGQTLVSGNRDGTINIWRSQLNISP